MLIKLPLTRLCSSFSVPSFQIRLSTVWKLPCFCLCEIKYKRNCLYCFKDEAYLEDHKSEIEKSYYPSILDWSGVEVSGC